MSDVSTDTEAENKVLSCIHVSSYQCLHSPSTSTRTASNSQIISIGDEYIKADDVQQREEINERYVSRFFFTAISKNGEDISQLPDDQARNCKNEAKVKEVITIEHKMATTISEVGFQVWSGALLLCDYLLHHHDDLGGAVVLDLGSGPGLTTIVAAMFAQTIICTDYLTDIVRLAERNWERNKDLIPLASHPRVVFKVLDWNQELLKPAENSKDNSNSTVDDENRDEINNYTMKHKDLQLLEDVQVILAAEVVYDDDITNAFFATIYHLLLMLPPAKQVLIALERRVVFSSATCEVGSPAYKLFRENLADLVSVDEGPVRFASRQIATDFPQYFEYKRLKELELWEISSFFPP